MAIALRTGVFAALAACSSLAFAGGPEPLTGVSMLPQKPLDDAFGDPSQMLDTHADIANAIRKVLGDEMLLPATYCSVHLDDGRDFFLISATTPNSDGALPHGVAYDWNHKAAYVARAWSERAKEAFFGGPDPHLRSVLLTVAYGCPNLRQKLGLDPYGKGASPAAGASTAGAVGPALSWPTAAACEQARLAASNRPGQTQSDFNMAASARDTVATCEQHAAYDGVARSVAQNPGALAKLALSQQKWQAFTDAELVARYPHRDEQGYYGSIFPMCVANEETETVHTRTLELRGEGHCIEGPPDAAGEKANAHAAMMAMVDVFTKVKVMYAKEKRFLDALDKAEKAWFAYETAQVDFVGETTGGQDSACAARELARVVRARNEQVNEWLKQWPEGDSCIGSYGGQ